MRCKNCKVIGCQQAVADRARPGSEALCAARLRFMPGLPRTPSTAANARGRAKAPGPYLGHRPLSARHHGAAAVQGVLVHGAVWEDRPEEERVALAWLHLRSSGGGEYTAGSGSKELQEEDRRAAF